MLQSAGSLAGVVGILFTVFGVIINLLQLYVPMPLFRNTSSSASLPQPDQLNPHQAFSKHMEAPLSPLQVYKATLASLLSTLPQQLSLRTVDKTFLWACFIVIPIISVYEIGVNGGISIPTAIGILIMSVAGLMFLFSNLLMKKYLRLDRTGNLLFIVAAEALFLSVLSTISGPCSSFSCAFESPTAQYFGILMLFLAVLGFIMGNIYLSLYTRAAPGALYGAILVMGGISFIFLQRVSFLGLGISLANISTGIAIFLATRGK